MTHPGGNATRDITVPYPGLRPFARHESLIFFGREDQIDQLLDKLGETHFLAVLGLSGSGKSSLVRAGLLPALEGGALVGAGAHWQVAEFRPGGGPIARLAEALTAQTPWGQTGNGQSPDALAELEEKLRRGPQALNWLLGVTPLAPGHRLLILADQFEELFRYPDRKEAGAFVALLLAAATHPDVYVCITLRSEFIGACGGYPDLPEAINAGLFLTPALGPEQLLEAISLPVRLPVFDAEVTPELARALLTDAQDITDPLPLLQHALLRLWSQREAQKPEAGSASTLTRNQYHALGGLQRALNDHLDLAFAELDPAHRPIAETLFRALVNHGEGGPGAGRDTRRPASVGEIARLAGVGLAEITTATVPFRQSGRNFLMPPADQELTPHTTLDITHEALIRQWQRLGKWTADEAEQAATYRRLREAALLKKKGEVGPLVDPALQITLDWREKNRPTLAWAERYGGGFKEAMRFLAESLAARQEQEAKTEARRRREIKRTRATALGALLGLLMAAGLALWANTARWSAVEAEKKTQTSELARTRALFDSALTHAALLGRVEDPREGRRVLAETVPLDPNIPDPRRHARNLLAGYLDILGAEADKVYDGAGAQLMDLALSPHGRTLVAAGERGALVIFDAETGELVKRLVGHDPEEEEVGAVTAVHFNRAGALLYSAGEDDQILRWALPTGKRVGEPWQASEEILALALGPTGKVLASGNRTITLWSTADGKKIATLEGTTGNISHGNSLAFTPDGRLISGGYSGDVGIWTLPFDPAADPAGSGGGSAKPQETVLPRIHTDQVNAVAVDPSGRWLATGSSDRRIVLWRLTPSGAKHVRQLPGHVNTVTGLRFVAGGEAGRARDGEASGMRLLSASYDNTMRLWDVESGATLRIFRGHTAGLRSIALDEDEDENGYAYTAANDGQLRRWPLATPKQWLWSLPGV